MLFSISAVSTVKVSKNHKNIINCSYRARPVSAETGEARHRRREPAVKLRKILRACRDQMEGVSSSPHPV